MLLIADARCVSSSDYYVRWPRITCVLLFQVWAMNHGLGLQLATGVAVTTPVTSQQPANNPIALQVVQTTVGRENP